MDAQTKFLIDAIKALPERNHYFFEPEELGFIGKVLFKKIEVFELPVKITADALFLLELYSGGNPGFAQLLLAELIENAEPVSLDTAEKIKINKDSIVDLWEDNYLKINDYKEKWDEQKDKNGNNKVDTVDWWFKKINTK